MSGQSYLSPKPSAGTPHASGPAAPVGTDADGAAPTVLERIHRPTMPGPGGLQRVSPWWRAAVTGHSYVTPEQRHD